MRRSLLLRLLGLSLAVAVFSIAATAWLTTRETSERFRGEFERTLEADTFIYQSLTAYAMEHDSWDGVGTLVDSIAEIVGRRVVVTTLEGDVLADSASSSGQVAPLPSNPTAEIM
jgi:two-component system, OmpR family, sensor histidine kinase BaeS